GFRFAFDSHALGSLGGDAHQTLRRNPARLLGGLGQALLAQPIDRALEIAARLVKRRLAIHHTRAGFLAEFFHHASGDVRHFSSVLIARVIPGAAPNGPLVVPIALQQIITRTGDFTLCDYGFMTMDSGPHPMRVPERHANYSASVAICSLARAIQASTRPGRPTSSPIWCAATGESSAICQTWKMPRSLSCFSIAGDTPGNFLRSSATPRGPDSG